MGPRGTFCTLHVTARSKAWDCGRSLAGAVDSTLPAVMDMSLGTVGCCQVELSAPNLPLVQGISIVVCLSVIVKPV
jgi:hypothetical protein